MKPNIHVATIFYLEQHAWNHHVFASFVGVPSSENPLGALRTLNLSYVLLMQLALFEVGKLLRPNAPDFLPVPYIFGTFGSQLDPWFQIYIYIYIIYIGNWKMRGRFQPNKSNHFSKIM